MNWEEYFINLWAAFLGKKTCTKEDLKEPFNSSSNPLAGLGIIVIIPLIILSLSFSVGSAMLSYHYNVYMGNSSSAIIWAILAYFFSGFYYPFYAFFLDPLPTMSPVMIPALTGSARRNAKY